MVGMDLAYCIQLHLVSHIQIANLTATHVLWGSMNVDIKLIIRLSVTKRALKPAVFFWRTRNMYSSSVRLEELPQSLAIVMRARICALTDADWRRGHRVPLGEVISRLQ